MADPGHVPYNQPLPARNPAFSANHQEAYGYNAGNLQQAQGQQATFNSNWSSLDPSLTQHHGSAYINNSSLAPNWATGSTPTPPQHNTFAPGSIYAQHVSSSAPFQHVNYSTPGSLGQYSQALDPALITPPQNQSLRQGANQPAAPRVNTISPAALHSNSSRQDNVHGQQRNSTTFVSPKQQVQPTAVVSKVVIPKSKPSSDGKFVIVDFEELDRVVPSKRLANFLSVGEISQDLPSTKSSIPQVAPRKSMNELRRLAVSDPKLAAKLGKRVTKASKPSTGRVGRPPKTAVSAASPSARSTSSEPSSEYESSASGSEYESEPEEEVPEPSPLPAVRSTEPLEAVRYDTMKAVWMPRNVPAQAEQIRKGLKEFWEVAKTIRDRWKSNADDVKKAIEAKQESEIPLLKERVQNQRSMMEMALRSALEHGHPDIVRLFGENKPLMFLFYQFLVERIGEKEYSGPFVKVALKLLAQCSTLTTSVLEEVKLNKVLLRFAKNGDDEVKGLAQKVIDQAAFNSKSKIELAKTPAAVDVKVKPGLAPKAANNVISGVKRPLSAEPANGQAAKRIASSSLTTASGVKAKPTLVAKKASALAAEKASTVATKPTIVSKTPATNFFTGTSAQKKPSSSGTEASAVKNGSANNVKVEKKAAAPARPAFSFAETMANLSKAQEPEPTVKEEDVRPDESPEERAKRLKKEERRKLRVSWKPEAMLVEVRIFHHDPDEELGHDANSVRDVGDINSEGRMFKQHMDTMDVDEEEDDQPKIQDYAPWKTPSEVDFSGMSEDSRTNNYKRFGGKNEPVSPEAAAMQQYVNNKLVVYYLTSADVPLCPAEPYDPYTGVRLETQIAGPPGPESVYTQRVAALGKPAVDVSNILQGLTPFLNQYSVPPAQIATPAYAPVPNMAPTNDQFADLQKLFNQHSAQPAAAPQAPPMGAPTFQPSAPVASAAAGGIDFNSLLAAIQPQSQPQAPQVAPPAPPMFFPPAPPAAAAPVPDLGSVLAQLGNNPQLLSMFTQNQQQQPATVPPAPPPQPQPSNANTTPAAYYEHPDRKRRREYDDQPDFKAKKYNKFKYKTVPCAYFKKGMCKKGDECTYLHDEA